MHSHDKRLLLLWRNIPAFPSIGGGTLSSHKVFLSKQSKSGPIFVIFIFRYLPTSSSKADTFIAAKCFFGRCSVNRRNFGQFAMHLFSRYLIQVAVQILVLLHLVSALPILINAPNQFFENLLGVPPSKEKIFITVLSFQFMLLYCSLKNNLSLGLTTDLKINTNSGLPP